MPFYKFTLPDGRSGRFEAKDPEDAKVQFNTVVHPDMMSDEVRDPSLPGAPVAPPPPVPRPQVTQAQREAQIAKDKELYDPAKGMAWYEKLLAGAGGGMTSAATGIGDLVGLSSQEAKDERKEWDARKGNLGGWGTAGEVLGEAAMTAPVGGPVASAGKVLTRAVPALAKVAGMGGKYLTAGTAARAGAEGALSAGMVGESSDKTLADRADDVAKGLGFGLTAPAVMKLAALPITLGTKAAGGIKTMLSSTATDLEKKVYAAFVRTLGEDGVADAYRAMTHAGPSSVPLSTAGLSGSQGMGALERGARGRASGGEFANLDERVARAAKGELNSVPKKYGTEAGEVLRSQFERNGVPVTSRTFGEGADRVPEIGSHPLRRALAKLNPHLSDVERDTFGSLAEDLAKHETYKHAVGPTSIDTGNKEGLISAGLALASAKFGSPGIWKARSAFNALTGNAKDKTIEEVDKHLADPDMFMNLVDKIQSKINAGMELTKGEAIFKQAVESTAAAGGRAAAAPVSPDKEN